MAKHLYRLRMGSYVGNLFRRSKHDLQQMLWLQYNLMRLGCDLAQSSPAPSKGNHYCDLSRSPSRLQLAASLPRGRSSGSAGLH
ncbi:hypothetical protein SAMN05216338_100267 [Bradyrhizobium sp. Rc2d]|nr:hypothetical protein SAMN05216338_100267 [Bradyrhizobium sp. Rc2d]